MVKKRLSKALAAAGIASRRAAEEIIQHGRVTVNGKKVLLPQTLVDFSHDIIALDHKVLKGEEPKVYYVLNKPAGFLCTNALSPTSKRVVDLFDEDTSRLFTVGRLDKETKGLLIVTNDGHFANKVMHPSSNVEKEYLAKVDLEIEPEHLIRISKGVFVEGTFVRPIRVQKIRKATLKIVVGEGKKREVRQLLDQAGLTVHELKRIRIGGLVLAQLPEGSFRPMTEREKALIFE
jgi:23S rRNA pseudouridine2605 synthase